METLKASIRSSDRFQRIKEELLSSPVHLDTERACLITEFYRKNDRPSDPMVVRKAKALHYLLSNKSVIIYPHELIVGNVGSKRISALMQPELAGVYMSVDLPWIERRKTTPLRISWGEKFKLLFGVIPYWSTRNMLFRALPKPGRLIRYVRDQWTPTFYLINEAGGIGHFLPDYQKMLRLGVEGYLESIKGKEGDFYRAVRIACDGLLVYARRLSAEARSLAEREENPLRRAELEEIAHICAKVPAHPAETFHQALQSLWLTHMAVNLESLNSAVSFGRMDQYLFPYYQRDLRKGRITRERAKELLLCFTAKAAEHVFLLSERISQYHGGYLVVQAAIVGGMDREGGDGVNDLTYLFLEVMEEAGLRDPNYQVRVHRGSPPEYLERVAEVVRRGNGVPAIFNDEASIASLVQHGYPLEEAREYAVVGCVELALPGKSFFSTDAGLFNLAICLEMALNQGRRFQGQRQEGTPTPPPHQLRDIDQVVEALRRQIDYMVKKMIEDLRLVERGNRNYHPTPFSSMLVDGCLDSGKDLTAGGARYNSSGIQGVGVADVADSLAALDEVVFRKKRYTLEEVVQALKVDFAGFQRMQTELKKGPKYGNDHPLPDGYAQLVVQMFHDSLARYGNTRGGPYVPGFYSVTCHVAFGKRCGALPSGRNAGAPLASSLSPCNGSELLGPTAVLQSVARVDSRLMPNGCAVNLRFDPQSLEGERGLHNLVGLIRGFMSQGGMQLQFNVLDPKILEDARRHPGKYPGLVVRVAGYCVYFDDLPDSAKGEIISRTRMNF